MAFDAGTVERVRDALDRLGERGSRERGVFGGRGFLQGRSTFLIVWGDGIIARMPAGAYPGALERRGVTAFAPDGERPMGTWVVVEADVIADDPELAEWVALSLRAIREGAVAKRPRAALKRGTRGKGKPDRR